MRATLVVSKSLRLPSDAASDPPHASPVPAPPRLLTVVTRGGVLRGPTVRHSLPYQVLVDCAQVVHTHDLRLRVIGVHGRVLRALSTVLGHHPVAVAYNGTRETLHFSVDCGTEHPQHVSADTWHLANDPPTSSPSSALISACDRSPPMSDGRPLPNHATPRGCAPIGSLPRLAHPVVRITPGQLTWVNVCPVNPHVVWYKVNIHIGML